MGNNLSVKITADIVDLQSKFVVARAEVSGLTAEMNKLARASAQGIIDPAGAARLQQVTSDFVAAKTQVAALGAQLSTASAGVLGFSKNLGESHGSVSTATREFRALFDELSSGRTRQTPGTLAIILQRVVGLGPAALGAIAGVGILSGGLGYLAYRAVEAANALNKIDLSTSFAGNMDITTTVVARYTEQLAKASSLSQSDARKIIAAFAAVPGMTNAALGALTQTISAFATATGESADKAAENLSKLFAQNVSAGEFAKKIAGVTQLSQAQLNSAQSADRSGDSSQIMASKLQVLNQAVNAVTPALKTFAGSTEASLKNYLQYTAAIASGLSTEEAQALLYDNSAAAIDKAAASRQRLIAMIRATPATPESTLKVGVETAQKENPVSQQITETQAKISQMAAALNVAQQTADTIDIKTLNAGLQKARENLSTLQFGPVLERMREQMAQVAASWDGTQSGMLAKQIQIAQSMQGEVQKNSKEYLSIQSEVSRLEVEMRKSAGAEIIANARERVSEIGTSERTGTLERLQAERSIWSQVLAGDGLNAAQRIEVQRSLNASIVALTRESTVEAATIARQDVAADISISRMKIEAAKSAINLTEAADSAAVASRLARLRELTAQEFALNEQALENELSTLNALTPAYNQVYNQIRELKAKLVLDLAKLDKQAADASAKAAKQDVSQWRTAVNEITSAQSSLIADMVGKRRSLSQSLLSIGSELLTKELQNDAKAITQRMLLSTSEQAADKTLESGGFLFHAAIEAKKAMATAQSQQAMTTANVAGNTSRLASQTAAAVESKTVAATTGASLVQADAAKAAAGAYSAVAGIPYVGPILAPIAATVAYGGVMAFESMASLDTGTNYVPRDMTAQIHKGEAVVPKQFNPAAGGRGGGDTHHHWNIQAADAESFASMLSRPSARDAMGKAMVQHFSRGGGRG